MDHSGAPVRLLPFFLVLFAGCGLVPGFGGQEGEDLEDTGGADTDATDDSGSDDTDTDDTDDDDSADVDTGPDDSGDTGDTGGTPGFHGPFVLDATAADGTADRCTGTVGLDVTDATIVGTASCTFAGPLATRFPSGLGATLDGAGTDPASGTVRFTLGATGDLAWTGSASASRVAGTFAGDLGGDAPIAVTGSFDAVAE